MKGDSLRGKDHGNDTGKQGTGDMLSCVNKRTLPLNMRDQGGNCGMSFVRCDDAPD